MTIRNIFSFLVPHDKTFFELFSKASANLVEIAQVLVAMVEAPAQTRPELIKKISELEKVGDDITHTIFTELSTNFITPFDREDISYLASSIDDIADFINGSAGRFETYKVREGSAAMKRLAEILELCAREIHAAVANLKDMNNVVRIREAIIRINSLENQADDVFDTAVADLFEREKDAVNLIKVKEILANLEIATDKCEDVANVIETILVKNS